MAAATVFNRFLVATYAICCVFNICDAQSLNRQCIAADKSSGICVLITNCDSFLRAFQSGSGVGSSQIGAYIQRSLCGYSGSNFLVCCPLSSFNSNQRRPTVGAAPQISTNVGLQPTAYSLPSNIVCGISNYTQTRVIGGSPARVGQYPWLAALGYRTPPSVGLQFSCAGSLITLRHVLTAAHCVSSNLYVARLGEYDLMSSNDGANPIDMIIDKKIIHEYYVENVVLNDIALLRLQGVAPITDQIRPICLPVSEPLRSQDLTGYQPFVAGWGSTIFMGPQSTFIREAQIPIVSLSDCSRNYRTYFPNQVFDSRVMCAGYGGRDTCQGDSGGPLMLPQLTQRQTSYYYVLIGIVSYGYECARQGFPGVYTRVATFVPWIQLHLND